MCLRFSFYSNKNIPDEIEKCFLLRGYAPMRPHQSDKSDKWYYVEESVLREMLGFSLQPFYPKDSKKLDRGVEGSSHCD